MSKNKVICSHNGGIDCDDYPECKHNKPHAAKQYRHGSACTEVKTFCICGNEDRNGAYVTCETIY